ncbi:hypothetical protein D3C71_1542850 [compost metagenome]
MPCPKLKTWPPLPTGPNASSTRRASARMAEAPPNSAIGSRLPWKATESPVRRRAAARSTVQSRPTASQPQAAICSSHWPPPLVKTMAGTRRPSCSRVRPATTLRVYASENCWNSPSASTPPQLSNSMTACAPAAICAFRYCSVASALISRMRCSRSGRAYSMVLIRR